jgi:hypothetical protein
VTRITNADQVLILLRSHLQRAQRARGAAKPARAGKRSAVGRVQQMASEAQLSQADLKRALVAGVLTEEFGPTIASTARFQQLVDDVLAIIERDGASAVLLRDAMSQLTPDD